MGRSDPVWPVVYRFDFASHTFLNLFSQLPMNLPEDKYFRGYIGKKNIIVSLSERVNFL